MFAVAGQQKLTVLKTNLTMSWTVIGRLWPPKRTATSHNTFYNTAVTCRYTGWLPESQYVRLVVFGPQVDLGFLTSSSTFGKSRLPSAVAPLTNTLLLLSRIRRPATAVVLPMTFPHRYISAFLRLCAAGGLFSSTPYGGM